MKNGLNVHTFYPALFVCLGDFFFAGFLFCFLFVWGYLMFNVQELIFCFLIVF